MSRMAFFGGTAPWARQVVHGEFLFRGHVAMGAPPAPLRRSYGPNVRARSRMMNSFFGVTKPWARQVAHDEFIFGVYSLMLRVFY